MQWRIEERERESKMIKTVSLRWLKKHSACYDAIEQFKKQKNHDLIATLKRLRRKNQLQFSFWLLKRVLPKKLHDDWINEWDDDHSYTDKDFLKIDAKYVKILEKMRSK